ncbi:cytochrome c [Marivita sp. S6314]|uniref:c-type cytochrome n=1 Tax=Marivita sp. S6314 TaxID=2926406 RepID=UPI001FF1DFED|nr:cytochrome c [Marivita sp. S6314]MCK0148770.1 cytochrome c [Marivita sp. S6314]
MSRLTAIGTVCLLGTATLAMAHSGVTNPAVMARMESMKGMQDSTKMLGAMLKGTVAFDAEAAREALHDIAQHAAETPDLFTAREMDPKSEALPVIWEAFEDFVEKSDALQSLATVSAQSLAGEDDLQTVMTQLGAACKDCHARYRE